MPFINKPADKVSAKREYIMALVAAGLSSAKPRATRAELAQPEVKKVIDAYIVKATVSPSSVRALMLGEPLVGPLPTQPVNGVNKLRTTLTQALELKSLPTSLQGVVQSHLNKVQTHIETCEANAAAHANFVKTQGRIMQLIDEAEKLIEPIDAGITMAAIERSHNHRTEYAKLHRKATESYEHALKKLKDARQLDVSRHFGKTIDAITARLISVKSGSKI